MVDSAIEHYGVAPHIYLVGTRPRISLQKDSFKIDGNLITCVLEIHDKDNKEPVDLKLEYDSLPDGLELTCDYPYTSFVLQQPNGENRFASKWSLMLQGREAMSPHLNFDILYIGQAFGDEGERNAADRLRSHETLQKIYAEAIQSNPDKEIWLNPVSYTHLTLPTTPYV